MKVHTTWRFNPFLTFIFSFQHYHRMCISFILLFSKYCINVQDKAYTLYSGTLLIKTQNSDIKDKNEY